MTFKFIAPILTLVASQFSFAAVKLDTKMIEYGAAEKFEAYISSPKNTKADLPAILIVHNWMGLTDETKHQADRFAELGYLVMALDIYGKGHRPADAKEAGALATKYKTDRKLFRERLNLGLTRLLEEKHVNKAKVAVAGYCFGGTGAIELARSGAPVLGAISFHGGLDSPNPQDALQIKAKILAHHGAIDPYVAAKDVMAFETELQNAKVDYQLIKYSGTVHSFTEKAAGSDITKGAAYNADSDRRSFESTKNFLKEIFQL